VLEHVADDQRLLSFLGERYLKPTGKVIMTIPAFPILFSSHDQFLGHFRRYTIRGVKRLVEGSGLSIISCGYFFFTLLHDTPNG
jgi:hypothetical protein